MKRVPSKDRQCERIVEEEKKSPATVHPELSNLKRVSGMIVISPKSKEINK